MQAAKDHLEKALKVTATKGCAVTDSEIAEHHYKLGRVMWIMGGNLKTSPKYARRHFEAASMEENDWQVCCWSTADLRFGKIDDICLLGEGSGIRIAGLLWLGSASRSAVQD